MRQLVAILCVLWPAFPACLRAEELKLEPVRVSADGKGFVLEGSGRRFRPWGVNYDHDVDGRLLEDYWHDEWATVEQDFAEMEALGANVVRVHLQLGRFMAGADEANPRELARLGDLLRLAERRGLYLDVTGLGCYHMADVPAWYDALDEAARWEVQARFWSSVAKTCAGSPAVFCYDLMNEPILPGAKVEAGWLAGEFGGKHFVQRIALDLAGRTREAVAQAWIDQLVDAIRKVDEHHLVTVGVIPWATVFPKAKPLFHDPVVGARLDFVSVHFYPTADLDSALAALRVYAVGKPLVVEECFPLKCSGTEMEKFIARADAVATGWVSFYWGQTAEQYEARGNELKDVLVADWLRRFQRLAPGMKRAE